MSRIEARFADLRHRKGKALIPYLMSGFPDRARFREMLQALLEEGADAVEIGLPFTDPLADGPVIQAAGQAALEAGVDWKSTLEDVGSLASLCPAVPRILMSYINPLRAPGLPRMARACRKAGIDGWIVPDRDLDEPREVQDPCRAAGMDCIPLVAPTTSAARLPRALVSASGFVYLVSVTGVTGARKGKSFQLSSEVARIREHTDLPVCIGFGVATGEQARRLGRWADGIIVGSALLEPFLKGSAAAGRKESLRRFREIRRALPS